MKRKQASVDDETRLLNQELDFSASYMAVKTINGYIENSPHRVTDTTVKALILLIQSRRFDTQKQVLFLFRETAETLISILIRINGTPGSFVIPDLQTILLNSQGPRHRAVAEALGSLPLEIKPPKSSPVVETQWSTILFQEIVEKLDMGRETKFSWQGRSLTAPTLSNRTGVIKFVKHNEDPFTLTCETGWMDFFEETRTFSPTEFDIPKPLKKEGLSLFKVIDIPENITLPENLHPERFAIVFSAAKKYYDYPNEPLDRETFLDLSEVLGRNARLLGKTASMGIIHTAVIPLFHNRVQQERRADLGVYQWEQSGRLDRWLESCRHPNFASCGLRDFEHFSSISTIKRLHHHIGSHFLSLILVAGSFFRNINPGKRGKDSLGNPVDARTLFDPTLFEESIVNSINQYYLGFTGRSADHELAALPAGLICSLIDEMGVDRHMEEILRVEDQNRMDQDEFKLFLLERGFSPDDIAIHERGKANIPIETGPHLGGFNQGISVPGLIDYIFSCASLCVCGRYLGENALKERKI